MKPVIECIRDFIMTFPELKDGCLMIDYLSDKILFRNQIYNIISVQADYAKSEYMAINCEIHEAGEKDDIY